MSFQKTGKTKKRKGRTKPRPEAQLFGTQEAAEYLGIGHSTFYRAMPRLAKLNPPVLPREFPGIDKERWRRADLDRLLESLPIHPSVIKGKPCTA